MSDWSDKTWRAKLPASAFAWPEKRMMPIFDAADVAKAVGYLRVIPAAAREAVRRRLRQLAKALGVAVPDESAAAPTFTAQAITAATFSAADDAADGSAGAWVADALAEVERRAVGPEIDDARRNAEAYAEKRNRMRRRK